MHHSKPKHVQEGDPHKRADVLRCEHTLDVETRSLHRFTPGL